MAVTLKDIYKILDEIEHHTRSISAKQTTLRSMLAGISIPEKASHECRQCGGAFTGERALAFHMQNVHDGPPVPLSDLEIAG